MTLDAPADRASAAGSDARRRTAASLTKWSQRQCSPAQQERQRSGRSPKSVHHAAGHPAHARIACEPKFPSRKCRPPTSANPSHRPPQWCQDLLVYCPFGASSGKNRRFTMFLSREGYIRDSWYRIVWRIMKTKENFYLFIYLFFERERVNFCPVYLPIYRMLNSYNSGR